MIIIGVLMAGCSIAGALGIVYTGGIKVPPYAEDSVGPTATFTPFAPDPPTASPGQQPPPDATPSSGQPDTPG